MMMQPEQGAYEIKKLQPMGADKMKDKSKFEYVELKETAPAKDDKGKPQPDSKTKNGSKTK